MCNKCRVTPCLWYSMIHFSPVHFTLYNNTTSLPVLSGRSPWQRHPGSVLQRPKRSLHLTSPLWRWKLLPWQRVASWGGWCSIVAHYIEPIVWWLNFFSFLWITVGTAFLVVYLLLGWFWNRWGLQCECSMDRRTGTTNGRCRVPCCIQVQPTTALFKCKDKQCKKRVQTDNFWVLIALHPAMLQWLSCLIFHSFIPCGAPMFDTIAETLKVVNFEYDIRGIFKTIGKIGWIMPYFSNLTYGMVTLKLFNLPLLERKQYRK